MGNLLNFFARLKYVRTVMTRYNKLKRSHKGSLALTFPVCGSPKTEKVLSTIHSNDIYML